MYRWVLIIEGLVTIAAVPLIYLILDDWPDKSRFLTSDERLLLKKRLENDSSPMARMDTLNTKAWRRILLDWKLWVGCIMFLVLGISIFACALFVPSIIFTLGYSGIEANVHSIPVWIVAAVTTLATSWLSHRLRHRYWFIIGSATLCAIGYAILLCQGDSPTSHNPDDTGLSSGVRYMAVFFTVTGGYTCYPLVLGWMTSNIAGHYKRAVGLAALLSCGNIGGVIASNLFVRSQSPRYKVGYSVGLAMTALLLVLITGFALGFIRENRTRNSGGRDDRMMLPEDERENLGDDDPAYRFKL